MVAEGKKRFWRRNWRLTASAGSSAKELAQEPARKNSNISERLSPQREWSERGPYADAWEHLAQELERIDLLIRLRLSVRPGADPGNPLQQLQGLVISEEEFYSLLTRPVGQTTDREQPNKSRKALLEQLRDLESCIDARRAASLEAGVVLSLPQLGSFFQLSRMEEQCLLICFGPEVDRKYDKLYAFAQDDVTRKRPSVELILSLLGGDARGRVAARAIFDTQAPLIKYKLLEVIENPGESPQPLLARSLKLDDRIANFLLGYQTVGKPLSDWAHIKPLDPTGPADQLPDEVLQQTHRFLDSNFSKTDAPQRPLVFHVCGPSGAGKLAVSAAIARHLKLPLLVADLEQLYAQSNSVREALWRLARESFLQPAVLCIRKFDQILAKRNEARRDDLAALLEAIGLFSQVSVLLGHEAWTPRNQLDAAVFLPVHLPVPDAAQRVEVWESQIAAYSRTEEVELGPLASQFRLTPGQIRTAVTRAHHGALWRSPDDGRISRSDLQAACRSLSDAELTELTRKIKPSYCWEDIALPEEPRKQLQEICEQARNRHIVFGEWGFGRKLSLGKGLSALFSGPPGTGKTMAAEVIAAELGIDLYKIDLSQVISKYIGESEKNLRRIFDAAEHADAILFFDEADALFGKRSEVRDSHDRYANVEVSYLLQKMEEYEGISILATNLRKHLDEAFIRRLQFIVEFPFPTAEFRERIWQVTFPREAPLGEDVDHRHLAEKIRLAGGSIKNIALNAAFYASEDGGVIGMPHLMQAAEREHQKFGRAWNAQTTQPMPEIVK